MARSASTLAIFTALAFAPNLAPNLALAQRPALTGEKARVAEAVKRDLGRLVVLQRAHQKRSKLFAADLRDLKFTPTSGAEVSIAFASMTAWAANASHAALSPVNCFVIISASDPVDAPTAQPFCTDAEPGTAAGRVASSEAPQSAPVPPASAASTTPASTPTVTPRSRPNTVAPVKAPAAARISAPPRSSVPPAGIRMITRDAGDGVTMADRVETVTSAQLTDILTGMAREATAVMDAPPPVLVRDPYESTQEYEARRAVAMAEYEHREKEYFRTTRRSFVVQLPVRAVRYDPDREVLEFGVEGVRLPVTREGRNQLTVACFARPVFWCMPDAGMTYDAADLWHVARATARQFDVLRTPMTLTARFTVGGRPEGERALAISLVDMELQARGQTVQRWPSR